MRQQISSSLLSTLRLTVCMSLYNNRTLEILKKAELEGYGVLAQVWYEVDFLITGSPYSGLSVMMRTPRSHWSALQNVLEVQPYFSYFLSLSCMEEVLSCAFA